MKLLFYELDSEDKRKFSKNSSYFSYDGGPLYKVTDKDDNTVGHIQVKENYICMIETYGISRGIGTGILEHFFKENEILTGNSLLEALRFWIKAGAKFSDYDKKEISKYFELTEEELIEQEENWNDYYPSFTLNKADFNNKNQNWHSL